jgi:hypothetical protein
MLPDRGFAGTGRPVGEWFIKLVSRQVAIVGKTTSLTVPSIVDENLGRQILNEIPRRPL